MLEFVQSSIVLQSITKSYAWGLISSRDFVDLIKWDCVEESGLHYTCGMCWPYVQISYVQFMQLMELSIPLVHKALIMWEDGITHVECFATQQTSITIFGNNKIKIVPL